MTDALQAINDGAFYLGAAFGLAIGFALGVGTRRRDG